MGDVGTPAQKTIYRDSLVLEGMIGVLQTIFSFLLADSHGAHEAEHGHGGYEKLEKHKKLHYHAKRLVDTVGQTWMEGYVETVNKHLRDKKTGEVDFEKMDDEAVHGQFKKDLKDFYVSKARDHFKVEKKKGDLNEFDRDALLRMYMQTTEEGIDEMVNSYGKRLTHRVFEEQKAQFQNQLQQRLSAVVGNDLQNEDIESIIKYAGIDTKVNSKLVDLNEAKRILDAYHSEGSLSDNILRQVIGAHKFKKAKGHGEHGHEEASHGDHGGAHH